MGSETLSLFHLPYKRSRVRGRWLLLLVFIVGYSITFHKFADLEFEYLGLTIASLLACGLVLSVLDRPLHVTAPVWLFLLLFIIAYYAKFYWIVYDPEVVNKVWFSHMQWIAESPEILVNAYATTTYVFTTFCLTAWVLIVGARSDQGRGVRSRIKWQWVISLLLYVIPLLMVVTTYLMHVTGIGIMAAESVYLPFRLAGVIFYARVALLPALLLLFIWCSDQMNLRIHLRLGITLLFVHGLSDIILRGSKGALLLLSILVLFLFLLTGRIDKKRVSLFMSVALLTILFWPVISAYRILRDPAEAVNIVLVQEMLPAYEILSEAFKQLYFRFTGMDSLLPIIATGIRPIGLTRLFDTAVERVFTVDVLGYSPHAIQGNAPGIVGWFHLVGGNYLAVSGVISFVLVMWMFWRLLLKIRLFSLPVAQALLLSLVFGFAMEGSLDRLGLALITTVGSITVCEVLIRNSISPHWLKKPPLIQSGRPKSAK